MGTDAGLLSHVSILTFSCVYHVFCIMYRHHELEAEPGGGGPFLRRHGAGHAGALRAAAAHGDTAHAGALGSGGSMRVEWLAERCEV